VSGRLDLTVQYATKHPWVPSRRRLAQWASAALGAARSCELTVRIVGNGESRALNRRYRNKDKPTNVLSFPATAGRLEGSRPLGDLVVCAPVVSAEAREQEKSREAHWAHMVVHGTLHLLGYDHQRAADARRMEKREIAVLARLGIADPYQVASRG
jgi:probable rRNA maturation factor